MTSFSSAGGGEDGAFVEGLEVVMCVRLARVVPKRRIARRALGAAQYVRGAQIVHASGAYPSGLRDRRDARPGADPVHRAEDAALAKEASLAREVGQQEARRDGEEPLPGHPRQGEHEPDRHEQDSHEISCDSVPKRSGWRLAHEVGLGQAEEHGARDPRARPGRQDQQQRGQPPAHRSRVPQPGWQGEPRARSAVDLPRPPALPW